MSRTSKAIRKFRTAEERLADAREELREALRLDAEGDEETKGMTLRELAEETGFTFGRVGQLIRGE